MKRPVTVAILALTLILCGSLMAGDDWAKDLFDHVDKDFGTVARGSKPEHTFPLTNNLKGDWEIEIVSMESTCRCTTLVIEKKILKPGESSAIVGKLSTSTLEGVKDRRGASITVKIQARGPGGTFTKEVQLRLAATVRDIVVIEPRQVELGMRIQEGTIASRKIIIDYARPEDGLRDWKITDIRGNSKILSISLKELHRSLDSVKYEIEVQTQETVPERDIWEQLLIITNDPNANQIPIMVRGQVVAPFNIVLSPLVASMYSFEPGEIQQKNVVLHASKSVALKGWEIIDDKEKHDGRFHLAPQNKGEHKKSKELHLLTLTFITKKTDKPETFTRKLSIGTDKGMSPQITLMVRMEPRKAPFFELSKEIDFGQVKPGERLLQWLDIESEDPVEIKWGYIAGEDKKADPRFRIYCDDAKELVDLHTLDIYLEPGKDAKPGPISQTIRVMTSEGETPEVTVKAEVIEHLAAPGSASTEPGENR